MDESNNLLNKNSTKLNKIYLIIFIILIIMFFVNLYFMLSSVKTVSTYYVICSNGSKDVYNSSKFLYCDGKQVFIIPVKKNIKINFFIQNESVRNNKG